IGASDLDEKVFSYADMPDGQADPELKNFSLAYDTLYLVPLLQKILQINPDLKIMGSPWSPPTWMKTNNRAIGGKLDPAYYASYAQYFVKYVQAMNGEGIRSYARSLRNEPGQLGDEPDMAMTPEERAVFVKADCGPGFQEAGIETKSVVFDHICDHPEYPVTVRNDM